MVVRMFKVAIFLVSICCFYWCHGCVEEERMLLLRIKDSISNSDGSSLEEDWVGKNCCRWDGVECNPSTSRVISIDLGSIREERLGLWYPNASLFAQFKELEKLHLRLNQIGGWVMPQAFSEMQTLNTLHLDENYLSASIDSLQGLCELKNLQYLGLGYNNLDGKTLPPCLGKLSMLKLLSLNGNHLGYSSGTLTGLCELKKLRALYLNNNNLDGKAIPPCLSNLSMLEKLTLYGNHLGYSSGALTVLSEMQSLRILDLNANNLSASNDSLRGICEMATLRELSLSDNGLNDNSIPKCLGNLSSLEILYLSMNELRGSLGSLTGICGLTALQKLYLYSSGLNDNSIPTCLGNLSSLEELYLSGNELRGSFGNLIVISEMQSLRLLNLGDNNLSASIDSLQGICELTALRMLYLYSNELNDNSIPKCLGNLSSLEELNLSGNKLRGSFGSLTGLKQLRKLYLRSNQLIDEGISSWIYNLTALTALNLEENRLKNPNTMRGFCNLRNLQSLDIGSNSFEGSIHPCLGSMHNLVTLSLSRSQFRGTIPSSIFANLTMLEIIIISQNRFDGLFSFSMFANLSKLLHVDLSENRQLEVETEYTKWVPTFQLRSLLLNNCILNKHSGSGIPTFISTQHSLRNLDISETFLQGIIPSWLLYNVTVNYMNLRDNSLIGPFPKSVHHNSSMVEELDVSNNNISSELPPNMDIFFPNLVLFNMSKNELQGTIPLSISKLRMLRTLDLSQNKLSGEMPHGLTTNNTSLEYLKLSNNKLQGSILSKHFNMTKLVVLLLDNNEFTGAIASNMLSSPSLNILDLRNNNLLGFIPSWLPSLMNLTLLLLGRNFFDGSIPTELCQLQNLHILDISNNKISGIIPSCLNNISSWIREVPIQINNSLGPQYQQEFFGGNMSWSDESYTRITANLTTKGTARIYEGLPFSLITGIDLSMNRLTGNIPLQMGQLKELHFLNLSNNILSGHFPESFQNLRNIESLDLSHNKLVGTIPPQIVQLNSLAVFSVAYNKLSGMIPYEKQFSTFNESCYEGNIGLCGPPLQRNCSSNNSSQTRDNKEEEEDGSSILDSPMFFYFWVATSYALGFWSFIALLCKKNWRHKFFMTVDRCFGCVYVSFSRFHLYLKSHFCN